MTWITEECLDTSFKGDLCNSFNIIPPDPTNGSYTFELEFVIFSLYQKICPTPWPSELLRQPKFCPLRHPHILQHFQW